MADNVEEVEVQEEENKLVIEYDVPFNDKDECKRMNESLGTNFRSTEEHILELLKMIYDGIYDVADKGGWYMGDGVKVKVELEYDPENK